MRTVSQLLFIILVFEWGTYNSSKQLRVIVIIIIIVIIVVAVIYMRIQLNCAVKTQVAVKVGQHQK